MIQAQTTKQRKLFGDKLKRLGYAISGKPLSSAGDEIKINEKKILSFIPSHCKKIDYFFVAL
jgi:hypothetical protein